MSRAGLARGGSARHPALPNALSVAGPPLLFGLRLWASVCLALFVAFWLKLDNAFWAGTSAAIVCQPQVGASLRKGWFLMTGTVVGATAIVVLTACFPQDRIAFLGILALWGDIGAFAATLLRNFASYSAALAGYTAAIIASDTLGATGGPNEQVFMLAVMRVSEISIGIVSAGIVLAGTDLGGVRRRLAALFAALAAEITGRFAGMLALAGSELPDTRPQRREIARRVIALDPIIDAAIGESSAIRYHSPVLQRAFHGLLTTLDGWRGVAVHLRRLPNDTARQEAETILSSLPPELRSAPVSGTPARWVADPMALRRICEGAVRTLLALPAGTPSRRLLADQTGKLLAGIVRALDGLALLIDAPGKPLTGHRGFRLSIPDWLPALVNGGRAFVTIGAVAFFWVATAWPSGASAIVFAAIAVTLFSPRADRAYAGALGFTLGTAIAVLFVAIIKFAALPGRETFMAFCVVIGLYLIPVGALITQPWQPAMFTAMSVYFCPLLAPANQMSYDTLQFYNSALAIFAGFAAAAFSFRLLPPLSPALRARRLLALSLRDFRRITRSAVPRTSDDWERRMYGRLTALPDEAEPLQRAQLVAVLSVGNEMLQLRRIARSLTLGPELDAALAALAEGNSAIATTWLARLDHHLASYPDAEPGASLALRARASILVISEALAEHGAYFDRGARV
jgi:uncharacterized membrane protein YccC